MTYLIERSALTEYLRKREAAEKRLDTETLFDVMTEGPQAQSFLDAMRGKPENSYTVVDGEAHIPIKGVLSRNVSYIDVLLGMAPALTYDEIAQAVAEANADPHVRTIVLDVNSPGGNINGVDVTAQAVRASAKPTEARVDNLAASAAYWIISQADKIIATTPVAQLGSIGVVSVLYDDTKMLEGFGVKEIIIASTDAPDKKAAYQIGTEEGQQVWQRELDALHNVFASRVSDGRKVSIDTVNKDFGRGGVLVASAALAAGMIDEIHDAAVPQESTDSAVVDGGEAYKPASAAGETMEVAGMDLNQLKTEHHDLYAQVFDSGREAGQKAEHARVTALQETAAADPDNEKLAELCAEAVSNGKTLAEIQPQVNVAIRDFKRDKDENPPTVATQQNETASGEKKPGESDTDAAIKAGVEEVLALYGEKEVARG